MKKGKLVGRLLSVILSAAMVVTSIDSSAWLLQVKAETVSENDVQSTTDVTQQEEAAEQEAGQEEENQPETPTAEEPEVDVVTPGEEATEEETEETEETEATEESVETEEAEEDDSLAVEKLDIDDSTSATVLIPDAVLRKALLEIYNKQDSAGLSEAGFQYRHLKTIKEVDLSEYNNASEITNVKGMQCVAAATYIDISTTGVTEIAEDAFRNNIVGNETQLETIILPENLKKIGNNAFTNCNKLKNIHVRENNIIADSLNSLPKGLESAGNEAFRGCSSLERITIDCSGVVLQYATGMFRDCTGLRTVSIGAGLTNLPSLMFKGSGDKETGMTVTFAVNSNMDTIGEDAFRMANVEAIDLSTTKIKKIGNGAFCRKESFAKDAKASEKYIKTLILPAMTDSLELGNELFFDTQVEKVYPKNTNVSTGTVILPDYVTKLGMGAFYNNNIITSVKLSANLAAVEGYTFWGCTKLETVITSTTENGDNAITRIGDCAFYNTNSLKNADFIGDMNHLEIIGEKDLKSEYTSIQEQNYQDYAAKLTPNQKVGSDVFTGSSIETLVLPASLKVINSRAFYQKDPSNVDIVKLKSVTWKSDVAPAVGREFKIASSAFENNTMLASFEYPKTDGSSAKFEIAAGAFLGCSSLVEFKETGTIYDENYSNNKLPVTLIKLGQEAFGSCSALPAIHITNNEAGESPEFGNSCFKGCTQMKIAELPSALTKVPDDMFYNAPLQTFPSFANGNAITEIGSCAFLGNAMTTLDLTPLKKLEAIDEGAFAYVDFRRNPCILAANYGNPPMAKVILPAGLPDLKLGKGVFHSAHNLETVWLEGYAGSQDKLVVIPAYVKNDVGASLFAGTGITEVRWQYEDDPAYSNRWTYIQSGMFNDTDIASVDDAMPRNKSVIQAIGDSAYLGCMNLTEINLTNDSGYTNLSKVGQYAFADCMNVTNIKLPDNGLYTEVQKGTFRNGYFNGLDIHGTVYYSRLESIDFGGVTKLGEWAFASYNDGCVDVTEGPVDSALPKLVFSGTKVEEIGNSAFKGHYKNLKTINFDGVKKIGDSAFELCKALVMTDTPMADSIETIGSGAFKQNESIGKVTFGSGLKTIGSSAFEGCAVITKSGSVSTMTEGTGLTAVDFSKAVLLNQIGGNAFKETALRTFRMIDPPVRRLESGVLSSCPYLQSVEFGDNLKSVQANAMNGCIALNEVIFSSTTTMDQDAFNSPGTFVSGDAPNKCTQVGKLSLKCQPRDLTIAKDRNTKFPYYVMKYDKNSPLQFDSMTIGDGSSPDDVYKYVKVIADTTGYYVKEITDNNKITQILPQEYKQYYDTVTDLESMRYKTEMGDDVITFDLIGLEETPVGTSIPFYMTGKFAFRANGETVTTSITGTYTLKVEDIPYHAVLYTDSQRTLQEDVTFDASTGKYLKEELLRIGKKNSSGSRTYYYDIQNIKNSNTRPDNCNLIIESSNPDIMTVGGGVKLETGYNNRWKITATEYSRNTSTAYAATQGKSFTLTPKKSGDVEIKIYPEGCPGQTTTLKFHVTADINNINFSQIPSEYSNGAHQGDTFNILDSVSMYLNQSVSKKNGDLNQLSAYTDNTITFTSSRPDLVSVDQAGNVTILAVSTEKVTVTITATVTVPEGDPISKSLNYGVSYPPLKNGAEIQDNTGANVKITGTPAGSNKEGSATYTKPAEGATNVVIPESVVVDGVECKITKIDQKAFQDNQTVTSITIPATVTELPNDAFKGCTNLTVVVMGDLITQLPASTFTGCTNLTTVKLSDAIKEIPASAFEGCKKLTTINIPKAATKIGTKAFSKCSKLTTVTIDAGSELTEIGENAFYQCSALTKITIPKKVTKIGKNAFSGCKKMKTVSMSSTGALTEIGEGAFYKCSSLQKITIPKKVTKIQKNAFNGCSKLKTVTFHKKAELTEIGVSAFANCKILTKITIPTKVNKIDTKAFYKCAKLKTITVKATGLQTVGNQALKGIYKKATIKVPKKKLNDYKELFKGKGQAGTVKIKK